MAPKPEVSEAPAATGFGQYHTFRGGVQQEMKRRLYAPAVLFIGLVSAQIVATVHVFLSNLDVLQATAAVMRGGYLAVPNAQVGVRLESLSTALAGGLFFTLSIGAGLSLTTLAAVWLWDRAFQRRRRVACLFLFAWTAILYGVNANGINIVASIYLIAVPLATGVAAIKLLPARTPLVSSRTVLWPVCTAVILALLWGLALDRHLFVNIRDHLLLPHRVGRSINDAYYAYTLYPAEAFKSLSQKQLRTCVLEETLARSTLVRLEQALRSNDYLPVTVGLPADLVLAPDAATTGVSLNHDGQPIAVVPLKAFLDQPSKALADYSDRLDRQRLFRRLTLVCLLIGFPLLLYSCLYSVLVALPTLFLTVALADMIAAFLCLALGVSLLVPVYRGHMETADAANAAAALASDSSVTRIAALRQAAWQGQDIAALAQRQAIHKSPSIAERYWLARSLAYTKDPAAGSLLAELARDTAPIVVCQALWAMGERNDRAVIPQLVDRVATDPHWYIQMYAYRALRRLGWVQPRSPLLSY